MFKMIRIGGGEGGRQDNLSNCITGKENLYFLIDSDNQQGSSVAQGDKCSSNTSCDGVIEPSFILLQKGYSSK